MLTVGRRQGLGVTGGNPVGFDVGAPSGTAGSTLPGIDLVCVRVLCYGMGCKLLWFSHLSCPGLGYRASAWPMGKDSSVPFACGGQCPYYVPGTWEGLHILLWHIPSRTIADLCWLVLLL